MGRSGDPVYPSLCDSCGSLPRSAYNVTVSGGSLPSEALYVADPVSRYLVRSQRRISLRPAYASQLGSGTRVTPCRPFLLSFPGFEAPCLKPSMRTGPGDSTNCVPGSHKNRSAFGGSLPPDASRYRWLPAARCPNLALSLSHLVRDFVCASPPSGRHPSSSSDATDLRATTAKRRSRAATQGLSPGNATVTSDVEGRIEAIVPSKCTW